MEHLKSDEIWVAGATTDFIKLDWRCRSILARIANGWTQQGFDAEDVDRLLMMIEHELIVPKVITPSVSSPSGRVAYLVPDLSERGRSALKTYDEIDWERRVPDDAA